MTVAPGVVLGHNGAWTRWRGGAIFKCTYMHFAKIMSVFFAFTSLFVAFGQQLCEGHPFLGQHKSLHRSKKILLLSFCASHRGGITWDTGLFLEAGMIMERGYLGQGFTSKRSTWEAILNEENFGKLFRSNASFK